MSGADHGEVPVEAEGAGACPRAVDPGGAGDRRDDDQGGQAVAGAEGDRGEVRPRQEEGISGDAAADGQCDAIGQGGGDRAQHGLSPQGALSAVRARLDQGAAPRARRAGDDAAGARAALQRVADRGGRRAGRDRRQGRAFRERRRDAAFEASPGIA